MIAFYASLSCNEKLLNYNNINSSPYDRSIFQGDNAVYKTKRKKLLLHICCAPCSAGVLLELMPIYDLMGFFYNPNIDDHKEHLLRANEMASLASKLDIPMIFPRYDSSDWKTAVEGLESEPEGGKRCHICYELRLKAAALEAERIGFDLFCTTLTVSPLKNAHVINHIGGRVGEEFSCNYYPSNFKKNDGFKKSVELSKVYNLYRQNYCGCSISKKIEKSLKGTSKKEG